LTICDFAADAVLIRAVDDDLVILPEERGDISCARKIQRIGNVLGLERPVRERHYKLEIVSAVEFRLQFIAID
jgi:hypothetical protein